MANIQAEFNIARHNVAGSWLHLQLTNGSNQSRHIAAQILSRQHKFGSSTEGIMAQVHRQGTCMSLLPTKLQKRALLAHNRGHRGHWEMMLLQDRPLLNMYLTVTEQFFRGPASSREQSWIGSASEGLQSLSHCYPICINQSQGLRIKSACHRFTSHIDAMVAQAFLVGKPQQFNSKWQMFTTYMQTLQAHQSNHHP